MSLMQGPVLVEKHPHTVFQQSHPKARTRLGRADVASAQSHHSDSKRHPDELRHNEEGHTMWRDTVCRL
jgi:hypothetical protein